MNQLNKIRGYSSRIKTLKEEGKKAALLLRSTLKTKKACEDAGYLVYYPHLLSDLQELREFKRIIYKDIKVYSKLLKEELKDERKI